MVPISEHDTDEDAANLKILATRSGCEMVMRVQQGGKRTIRRSQSLFPQTKLLSACS